MNSEEIFLEGRGSSVEVLGTTEANKKITSCNGNWKGRREIYAFNYDNTSLSGKLKSTRKSLIINIVITEKCLLPTACSINSG